jgi:hypothetical protein
MITKQNFLFAILIALTFALTSFATVEEPKGAEAKAPIEKKNKPCVAVADSDTFSWAEYLKLVGLNTAITVSGYEVPSYPKLAIMLGLVGTNSLAGKNIPVSEKVSAAFVGLVAGYVLHSFNNGFIKDCGTAFKPVKEMIDILDTAKKIVG